MSTRVTVGVVIGWAIAASAGYVACATTAPATVTDPVAPASTPPAAVAPEPAPEPAAPPPPPPPPPPTVTAPCERVVDHILDILTETNRLPRAKLTPEQLELLREQILGDCNARGLTEPQADCALAADTLEAIAACTEDGTSE